MTTIRHSPGPAAAEAFSLGITTTATLCLVGLWVLFEVGVLALHAAVLAAVFGVPIALLIASCLLSIWLGYNKDAVDVALS